MKPLLGWLSPAGHRARLSTLIFHRVLPEPDPLFPEEMHAARFDSLCGWLANWFNVLPLAHAVDALAQGRLPARALAITFDDGYADNHQIAAPILQRHGLSATFFVTSGYLDGGCMWNDVVIQGIRHTRLPVLDLHHVRGVRLGAQRVGTHLERRTAIDAVIDRIKYLEPAHRQDVVQQVAAVAAGPVAVSEMMTSDQVRDLVLKGMDIGGHTVTHPILARLNGKAARREIQEGKDRLESILGARLRLFAYPNGRPGIDYGPDTVAVARRCGFDAAVTTAWGSATAASDLFQLPRFTPWDHGRLRFGLRLASNLRHSGRMAVAQTIPT